VELMCSRQRGRERLRSGAEGVEVLITCFHLRSCCFSRNASPLTQESLISFLAACASYQYGLRVEILTEALPIARPPVPMIQSRYGVQHTGNLPVQC
jgi:hypothetical protein